MTAQEMRAKLAARKKDKMDPKKSKYRPEEKVRHHSNALISNPNMDAWSGKCII